jgi:hypothetical protein
MLRICRIQWPRGLRRGSAAARLLRLWIRIPPGAWMSVCCECCVLSRRGLCDELIILPEESNRMWCVVVCDLETSWMRTPWPHWGGCCAKNKRVVHLLVWIIKILRNNTSYFNFFCILRNAHYFRKNELFVKNIAPFCLVLTEAKRLQLIAAPDWPNLNSLNDAWWRYWTTNSTVSVTFPYNLLK